MKKPFKKAIVIFQIVFLLNVFLNFIGLYNFPVIVISPVVVLGIQIVLTLMDDLSSFSFRSIIDYLEGRRNSEIVNENEANLKKWNALDKVNLFLWIAIFTLYIFVFLYVRMVVF